MFFFVFCFCLHEGWYCVADFAAVSLTCGVRKRARGGCFDVVMGLFQFVAVVVVVVVVVVVSNKEISYAVEDTGIQGKGPSCLSWTIPSVLTLRGMAST